MRIPVMRISNLITVKERSKACENSECSFEKDGMLGENEGGVAVSHYRNDSLDQPAMEVGWVREKSSKCDYEDDYALRVDDSFLNMRFKKSYSIPTENNCASDGGYGRIILHPPYLSHPPPVLLQLNSCRCESATTGRRTRDRHVCEHDKCCGAQGKASEWGFPIVDIQDSRCFRDVCNSLEDDHIQDKIDTDRSRDICRYYTPSTCCTSLGCRCVLKPGSTKRLSLGSPPCSRGNGLYLNETYTISCPTMEHRSCSGELTETAVRYRSDSKLRNVGKRRSHSNHSFSRGCPEGAHNCSTLDCWKPSNEELQFQSRKARNSNDAQVQSVPTITPPNTDIGPADSVKNSHVESPTVSDSTDAIVQRGGRDKEPLMRAISLFCTSDKHIRDFTINMYKASHPQPPADSLMSTMSLHIINDNRFPSTVFTQTQKPASTTQNCANVYENNNETATETRGINPNEHNARVDGEHQGYIDPHQLSHTLQDDTLNRLMLLETAPSKTKKACNERKISNTERNDHRSQKPTQVKIHPGSQQSKKYTCIFPGCNNGFSTSGHLARHIRLHTGAKPYSCPIEACLSTFSRHDNMTTHYRSHIRKLKAIKVSNNTTNHQ